MNLIKVEKAYFIFIIANILSAIRLFLIGFPAGLFLSLLMLLFFVPFLINIKINFYQLLFILFFSIELLSITNYLFVDISHDFIVQNDKVFFQSISYLIIPQLFFFLIGNFIGRSNELVNENIWLLLKCNFVLVSFGIILHFWRPDFFLEFHKNEFLNIDYGKYYPRLTGYMNSLILGIVCPVSAILATEYAKKWKSIFICVFIIGSFLTLQRGALIDLLLGLTILLLINKLYNFNSIGLKISKKTFNSVLYIVLAILVLIALLFILYENSYMVRSFVINLKDRVANLVNSVFERNKTWLVAIKIANEYPLGLGIGLLSHKGADANFIYAVPDGNYFRILGDLGYIGLISFITVLITGITLILKQKRYSIFAVLICFTFHALGTNVFDLYYASFIFWFLLGIGYATYKAN